MIWQLKDKLGTPIIGYILRSRATGLMITAATGSQAGLMALGLPGWPCPFWHGLGIPCPGCGLSRATGALVQGDWQTALTLHAFAPFFLLALGLIAGATLLPHQQRHWLIDQFERVEYRTGITAILLIGLVIYWLVRLLIFPEAFISLIKG